MKLHLVLIAVLAVAGCREDKADLGPVAMTDEAIGHYCQMYLADHGGPKAQIRLEGYQAPVWFAQVSDAAAFIRDPEKLAPIAAIYVSDMDKAPNWAEPGRENWIAASEAHFVIDSRTMGGMGTPEAIPFGTEAGAAAFIAGNGGRMVAFDAIPEGYGLAEMPMAPGQPAMDHAGHGMDGGEMTE